MLRNTENIFFLNLDVFAERSLSQQDKIYF